MVKIVFEIFLFVYLWLKSTHCSLCSYHSKILVWFKQTMTKSYTSVKKDQLLNLDLSELKVLTLLVSCATSWSPRQLRFWDQCFPDWHHLFHRNGCPTGFLSVIVLPFYLQVETFHIAFSYSHHHLGHMVLRSGIIFILSMENFVMFFPSKGDWWELMC